MLMNGLTTGHGNLIEVGEKTMKARIRVVHHKNKTASYYPEIFFEEEWINIARYRVPIHSPVAPAVHATERAANEALDYFFYEPPTEEILEYRPNRKYSVNFGGPFTDATQGGNNED